MDGAAMRRSSLPPALADARPSFRRPTALLGTVALAVPGLLFTAAQGHAEASPAAGVVLTVAKDGGQFTSVQAAVNAVPNNSATAYTISIAAGTYSESVVVPAAKLHLTLLGATGNATDVVIQDSRYAGQTNPSTGAAYGTLGSATVTVLANDFTAEFITFSNAFNKNNHPGVTGTQAVALAMQGDRQVYEFDKFWGHQDTLLSWSNTPSHDIRQYIYSSVVDGDVDFIFGNGTLVVDRSTINVENDGNYSSGALTAPATYTSQTYGILITGSTVASTLAANTVSLGRAWVPYNGAVPQAVIRNTVLPAAIAISVPWVGISGAAWTPGRNFEYSNTGPGATANANRPQLSSSAAANYTAAKYLAGSDGWNPVV
jgi:pectin methylesterase-like acyl-CoA thioesterase